jgi:hypothetical protein
LSGKAAQAAAAGNVVRSAILWERAAQAGPEAAAPENRARAAADLDRLTQRFQAALALSEPEAAEWREALAPLLAQAARGGWSVEARLLYDLQKVCVDHERGVYAVDPVEWALSLGRRPVKRPLPSLREARIVKHLQKAAGRMPLVWLDDLDRHRLAALLRAAAHRGEDRLRDKFRPLILGALDKVGLRPNNYPERIARHKLVEEVLDRITERGFLAIGDLRDALSRNNLKLPDLAGPGEFLRGDPLLRLDRELAAVLDGVYRRGEVYMRGLQKFSSLAFGTRAGRFLTRYLALPFGGAFVILEGLQHLVGLATKPLTGSHPHLLTPASFVLSGCFLFALLFIPPFRRGVGAVLGGFFRGVRGVCYDAPAAFLRVRMVQQVMGSPPVRVFQRYLFAPLFYTALALLTFTVLGWEAGPALAGAGAVFLIAFLVLNSGLGRTLEETFTDWLIRNWAYLRTGLFPGLFAAVMEFFRRLVEIVERLLYTMDEWFRFRSGESRLSLVMKAVFGPVWFALTYIVRFCINLLIEPQINPIKHFPVVTVSHKLLLPTIPALAGVLEATMEPATALTVATMIITSIPGIFGFLVWELKENWKLYQANRSPTLKPVLIGHHGETMPRLLRPGFHSGTLPKLFAKLRKADRKAFRSGHWKAARQRLEAVEDAKDSLRHFLERELVRLLQGSPGWGLGGVAAGDIRVGAKRVLLELCCPELRGPGLWIAFDELSGWLTAGIDRPGWLAALSPGQRQVLAAALAGFYKLAGVDLIREQIEQCLRPARPPYDITGAGLVVWTDDFKQEAVYDLCDGEAVSPQPRTGFALRLPVLPRSRLLYQDVPVTWDSWVEAWEQDQAGKGRIPDVAPGVQVLPESGASRENGIHSV